MKHSSHPILFASTLLVLLSAGGPCVADDLSTTDLVGLQGGLIVQLGAADTGEAAELSRTGRYLIHLVDHDEAIIASAQRRLHQDGRYGLAWAEKLVNQGRLPYAENVVNLIVAKSFTVPVREMHRVLTPGGKVLARKDQVDERQLRASNFESIEETESHWIAVKAWPDAMDDWSHPRHAADGNAVSLDTMVGPPERVRWIAAATSEVEGMVSAGGRNFYGGILARDSFNGLRLWHRRLTEKGDNNPANFELPRTPGSGRPIASGRFVFASLGNHPVALDASTGEVVTEFDGMQSPKALLYDGTRMIAADNASVRAFDISTGGELWNASAAEPRNVIGDGNVVAFIKGNVKRGERAEAVVLNADTGEPIWQREDYPWLVATTRTVLAKGQLVFEVSTLNDHDDGNAIHVVSASTGEHQWSKNFPPGMNHARQARAMFLEDDFMDSARRQD